MTGRELHQIGEFEKSLEFDRPWFPGTGRLNLQFVGSRAFQQLLERGNRSRIHFGGGRYNVLLMKQLTVPVDAQRHARLVIKETIFRYFRLEDRFQEMQKMNGSLRVSENAILRPKKLRFRTRNCEIPYD